MKRVIAAAGVVVMMAVPAFADVTITSTGAGKGMGMGKSMQSTTYIKGARMRAESTVGDMRTATIFDLDAQKMIVLNLKKKEAEVTDLGKLTEEAQNNLGAAEAKVSFKPNGQTKEIAGKSCTGYDFSVSMPMNPGGKNDESMAMTMVMAGPVWIAKNAPGSRDFAAYYRAAAEKGFVFNSPQQAKAQPGQAKAFAEMYRAMIATGGVPYGQEIKIAFEGGGPMGAMMSKMGGVSIETTVTDVNTNSLSDELFTVPADFKVKTK